MFPNASAPLRLRWRATFIDVEDSPAPRGCGRARSVPAKPASAVAVARDAAGFTAEAAYVEGLGHKLAWFDRTTGSAPLLLPTTECIVAAQKPMGKAFAPDATSLLSTAVPTTASDLVSDAASDDAQAVAALAPNVEMWVAQGLIRNIGQTFSSGPAVSVGEMVAGPSAPSTINTNLAHMLMRVKAGALQAQEADLPALGDVVGLPTTEEASVPPPAPYPAGHCSRGSVGHPELCNRPCLHLAVGHCERGDTCEFCHMGHNKRPVHLDKRHREMLRTLSREDGAMAFLPILCSKVQALDNSAETTSLLARVVEAFGMSFYDLPAVPTPARHQRMLVLTLRSLTLKMLLSTAQRSMCAHGEAIAPSLEALLQHLRRLTTDGTISFDLSPKA